MNDTVPDSVHARTVDARGLACPLPLVKASRALREMAAGQTLVLLATDPAAPADIASLCRHAGHRLVASDAEGGIHRFVIVKAAPASSDPGT